VLNAYILNLCILLCTFVLQQEIGEAAVAAQRKFYEKFPNREDWFAKSVHEFINKAIDKVRTSILSELKKHCRPKHTKYFFKQVKSHYECNDNSLEMQQEILSRCLQLLL
jgi:hypothetical protein